jgi:hypothetical protein
MVEEVKVRLTELRAVAACQHWLDQVTASPPVRVKQVGVDTSGIDEALAPIGKLLSGASGEDLAHFLANQRQGTSGQAFTITPGAVSNPTAGR